MIGYGSNSAWQSWGNRARRISKAGEKPEGRRGCSAIAASRYGRDRYHRGGVKHIGIIAAIIIVFAWLGRDSVPASPYGYDESDYMYAAAQGWLANYIDTPTQSIVEFVRMGLESRGGSGTRGTLSEYIRASGDLDFYRHWHGPLYVDWLIGVSTFRHDEWLTRMLGMLIPAAGIILLYVGTLGLFGSTVTAILAAVMYGWGYVVSRTTIAVPHQLFALCYLASLMAAAFVLKTKNFRYWYLAAAFAALAFATLEVAFVLIGALILFAVKERSSLPWTRQILLRSGLVFVGTVLAVYPAGLLKLSFLKSYTFMAYLAVSRKSPWGDVTLGQTWRARFENAPFEWLLILAAVALFLRGNRNPAHRYARPLLYFSVLMIVVTLRVMTVAPQYMLPFVPALALFSAWTLGGWIAQWPAKAQIAATALVCGLMLTDTSIYAPRHPFPSDEPATRLVAAVRSQHLEQGTLIIPHDEVPVFHYYFPQAALKSYLNQDEMENLARAEKADALVRPNLDLELRR